MRQKLKNIRTTRFLKFCTVGASGVLVNMLFLFLFSDVLGVHVNLSIAIAIWLSILSNFAVNELWTFKDRREGNSNVFQRMMIFHAVSILGGSIQWFVFVVANATIAEILGIGANGNVLEDSFLSRYVFNPSDVGNYKYLAQLVGIGVATFFNFFANLYWTWGKGKAD